MLILIPLSTTEARFDGLSCFQAAPLFLKASSLVSLILDLATFSGNVSFFATTFTSRAWFRHRHLHLARPRFFGATFHGSASVH